MAKTPTTPTDADRIRAAGVELTLDTGTTVRLRFDLATLHRIEQHHGGLAPFTEQLQAIQLGAASGGATPWIGQLREVLAFLYPDVPSEAFVDEPLVLAALLFMAWLEAFPAPDPKGPAATT